MPVSVKQLTNLKSLMDQEPYVSMADDEVRRVAMMDKSITTHPRVDIGEVQRVLMAADEWWNIEDSQGTNQAARKFMSMLTARFDDVDVFSNVAQAAFTQLVSDGLMSQASRDTIEALGTVMRSPAEESEIGSVVRIGWFDRARSIV